MGLIAGKLALLSSDSGDTAADMFDISVAEAVAVAVVVVAVAAVGSDGIFAGADVDAFGAEAEDAGPVPEIVVLAEAAENGSAVVIAELVSDES